MIAAVAIGLCMTVFCLALQTLAGLISIRLHSRPHSVGTLAVLRRLSVMLVVLMLGIVTQMAAWATAWRLIGQFQTFEEALYFSGVTFTSLGYGDVVVKSTARLLAPLEAANGLIMFAVVTALFMNALQREAGVRNGRSD